MEALSSDRKGGAKGVLNLQPNSSISIAYHPLFALHDDLLLLELDEKFIPDIFNQSVSLRGQPNEDAVLCTESKTYAVKFVGTSNSVFLIPPSDEESEHSEKVHEIASVYKLAPGVMEIVEIAPKLDKLKSLLSQNPYTLSESSEMDDSDQTTKTLYRWDDLVETIQASDKELQSGLNSLLAVEINGYYRILDENYIDNILNMLLHNIILNDWSRNSLQENEVISVLEQDGYSYTIAKHCLQVFCKKSEDNSTWKLDEKRVCIHFAKRVLQKRKMKLESFMEEWNVKVPDGLFPSFDMLEGEVLTEKIGIETLVYAYSVSSLPSTPSERFEILFKESPKWEWKDLQPFVRDLKVPGLSSEGILLKYTRRTQPNADAPPIFSAR